MVTRLRVDDDELPGVEGVMHCDDDGRVVRMEFVARNGHSITAADLGLMARLRTLLPGTAPVPELAAPEPAPAAAKAAPAKKATAKKAVTKKAVTKAPPAKKAPVKKATAPAADGRVYRERPDDFVAKYVEFGGETAKLRDHYDVPRHTVQGWARTLRARGALPELPAAEHVT